MSVSKAELQALLQQMQNGVRAIYDEQSGSMRQGASLDQAQRIFGFLTQQMKTLSVLARLDEEMPKRSVLVLRRAFLDSKMDKEYKVEEVHNSLEYAPGESLNQMVVELLVGDPMWVVRIVG